MKKFKLLLLSLFIISYFTNQVKTLENSHTKISEIFIDLNLAQVVADSLSKTVNDEVSQVDLNSIEFLDAQDKDITNLSGLDRLTNTYGMNLSHNKISDLSVFTKADYSNLQFLVLTHNKITDISDLHRLNGLIQLFLDNNYIDDISPALTFTSYLHNISGSPTYNLYSSNQTIEMSIRNNYTLSKNIHKYALETGTYLVYDISNDGVYDETNEQVNWDNSDLSITEATFKYALTNFVPSGTWTYSANVTLKVQPALVNVKYVSDTGDSLDNLTLKGIVSKPYTTSTKSFSNYILIKEPTNKNGYFKNEDQLVTYVYKKISKDDGLFRVNIIHIYDDKLIKKEVKYVERNTDIDLSKWLKLDDKKKHYHFEKLSILPQNQTIIDKNKLHYTFTSDNNEVSIYYKSTNYILPKSGNELSYLFLSLITLTYVFFKYKKKLT